MGPDIDFKHRPSRLWPRSGALTLLFVAYVVRVGGTLAFVPHFIGPVMLTSEVAVPWGADARLRARC